MLHTHKRITAGIAALALTLGTAAPAIAMPNTLGPQGPNLPAAVNVQPPVQATAHHSSGNGSDWGYIAAGATSVALIGIGGTLAGRRHSRTRKQTVTA